EGAGRLRERQRVELTVPELHVPFDGEVRDDRHVVAGRRLRRRAQLHLLEGRFYGGEMLDAVGVDRDLELLERDRLGIGQRDVVLGLALRARRDQIDVELPALDGPNRNLYPVVLLQLHLRRICAVVLPPGADPPRRGLGGLGSGRGYVEVRRGPAARILRRDELAVGERRRDALGVGRDDVVLVRRGLEPATLLAEHVERLPAREPEAAALDV